MRGEALTSARGALVLALALAGCGAGDRPSGAAGGEAVAAPVVHLTEHGGRRFDLAAERGNVVLLFFGYTHCPDICPTTLADFVTVKRRLGMRAGRVRFVFISVDPARDSPEVAQRYARGFDRDFIGLTGDSASLAVAQRSFQAGSSIERDATGEITVVHSASVFLVGPDGRLLDRLPFGQQHAGELYAAVARALGL